MTRHTPVIERLLPPGGDSDLCALALLLVDAVGSGAAANFLAPLTPARAEDWWRRTISTSRPGAIFLVARDFKGVVGTVQLHPAWAPNQPHRAEVAAAGTPPGPPRGPGHPVDGSHRGRGAGRGVPSPDTGHEAGRRSGSPVPATRMDPRGSDSTVCSRSGRHPARRGHLLQGVGSRRRIRRRREARLTHSVMMSSVVLRLESVAGEAGSAAG